MPTKLRAEERRWRRGDFLAVLGALVVGAVLAWVIISLLALQHELRTSNDARDALAAQVQQMGGTPVAGTPGSRGEIGPSGEPGTPGRPGRPAAIAARTRRADQGDVRAHAGSRGARDVNARAGLREGGEGATLRRPAERGRCSAMRTAPPCRADHIGSLLRPRRLRDAYKEAAAGRIGAAEFDAVLDDSIR